MQQLISIIIATYNRPDALEAVLRACFAQTDTDFEIIIADDGSAHNTRQTIARLKPQSPVPLCHVWQEDLGFRLARIRNLGTQASSGEYLIFLDGDCVPQRDFVARHRMLAEPGYLVCGSRILLSEQLTRAALGATPGLDLQRLGWWATLRYRLRGDLNKILQLWLSWPDLWRRQRHFSWRRIKGCNLGFWRSDLYRVNGFDESFLGWGHEDADVVVRLFNAGVLRKDGAFATEVLHLWHKEAVRDQASSNRRIVLERAADKSTQAVRGLLAPAVAGSAQLAATADTLA